MLINNELWTAVCGDAIFIREGDTVKVVATDGAILTVEPIVEQEKCAD